MFTLEFLIQSDCLFPIAAQKKQYIFENIYVFMAHLVAINL